MSTDRIGGRAHSPGPWRQAVGLNPARIAGATPYIHRFGIGIFDAAIVSDGPLILSPLEKIYPDMPPADIAAIRTAEFIPGGTVRAEQNVLLLDIGGHLVLFDNGMGASTLFGPHAGRLPKSLAEAGLRPEQIDALVFSHAHPDHCWGTVHEDGTPVFPNAQLYISETELSFWENCTEPGLARAREGVARNLLGLRERIAFFRDDEEFLPGIHALAAPGHTPGHFVFVVASAEEEVCVTADVAFHNVLSFAHPDAASVYDQDTAQGAATRRHLLGRLADERMRIIGYHLPWPGIGHVARHGDAFRYIQAPIQIEAPA
jgi:glyoxylase-like metal-dependent hydrolase (beta-lactamase superfamily II)